MGCQPMQRRHVRRGRPVSRPRKQERKRRGPSSIVWDDSLRSMFRGGYASTAAEYRRCTGWKPVLREMERERLMLHADEFARDPRIAQAKRLVAEALAEHQ